MVSKQHGLTRQEWETALAALRWGAAPVVKAPPADYLDWLRENAHCHDYPEILVCLSGSHFYGIDGVAHRLAPGSVVLFPNRQMHDQTYDDHHQACVDFWLHFLPHGRVTMNFIFHTPGSKYVSHSISGLAPLFADDLKKAATLLHGDRNLSTANPKREHFILYLLHEIFETLMEKDLNQPPDDELSLIEEIKRYACEHLTDRLSLTDLAKAAGYSPFHFHRIFVEAEGITPRLYVEGRRLKRACELLRNGHSMTSAALEAGFSSSSQFCRVFRKRFELSPTEWLQTGNSPP
ncbi:MAG TPA: AraC family transcriptional regulator [Chthoniobacteraceae bacterium]|nr:AraC family transcriptional regulator [Chthoniobacteraceae bacterium]